MSRAGSLRAALVAGSVAFMMVAAGCTTHLSQLSFRVDKRLHFVAPKNRSLVTQPVTLRWTMRDFTVAGPNAGPVRDTVGYFAIFVDRAPIRPGQTLKALAKDDRACQANPACPDEQYLSARQVYTTTNTSFTLDRVASLTDTGDDTQLHDVILVLMDTSGHRIGESFWHTAFKLKKRTFG